MSFAKKSTKLPCCALESGADKLLKTAIDDLNVFECMSHTDFLFVLDSPESRQLFTEIGDFFKTHLASE